jgi:type IV pilus assembly protein PilO
MIFLSYKFIYMPQADKAAKLKAKAADYQQKADIVQSQLVTGTKLREEYKITNAKIMAITGRYVPVIVQEKLILALNKMIDESGVEVDYISFEDIQITDLNKSSDKKAESAEQTLMDELMQQYGLKPQEGEKQQQPESSLKVMNLKADISFYSSYGEALRFLKLLESYEKRIVIEYFNLNQTTNRQNSIKGNVKIVFYTLPQLDTAAVEQYDKWDIENSYGKNNPFTPYGGYTGPAVSGEAAVSSGSSLAGLKFNFIMAVSPIMSDLPSVFFGRNDNSSSYVYADNKGFEDVELQLQKMDGKYYCRYRTSKASYPEDYNNGWREFKPSGQSINLQIVSAPRTGSEDKTGANLSFTNKTDLPLRVFIKDDDTGSSRIKLVKQEGSINISRE